MNVPLNEGVSDDLVYAGTVLCDRRGVIQWMDDALARWLQVEPEAWRLRSFDGFFVPCSRADALREWPRAGGEPWDADVSGHPHRVQVRVTALPVGEPGMQVCSIVAFDAYVMEHIAAGRARLRTTIGAVVAGFAHEVRNPLASILTLTELAIRELRNSYVPADGLMRIPALVNRIERLMRQTIEYGRPPKPVFELLCADYLLHSALRMIESRFPGVSFELCSPPHTGVYADRQQAEQVLCNLLQNACEAGATHVQVFCETDRYKQLVHIRIADNGTGLAPEVVPRIFDPFFTSKAQGTGLGLAIARDLARLNQGDLRLVRNEPDGATFEFTLRDGPAGSERTADLSPRSPGAP